MRKMWWKYLSLFILAICLVLGLLVPLKPGILRVDPDLGEGGRSLEFRVEAYNTHFREAASQIRVWLKLDNEYIIGGEVEEVLNQREMVLSFRIPEALPYKPEDFGLTLLVDHPIDGAFVLPGAIFVKPGSVKIDPAAAELWTDQPTQLNQLSGIRYPFRNILYETIRNTYFHVPLWFGMIIILTASMVYSVRYLRAFRPENDLRAVALANVGLLFGILGLVTGAVWANYTWGSPWSNDIKQLVSAIALLIYLAYFILRMAIESEPQRARLSAIYNIFAFATLIPLLFVIPRLGNVDSLHPGNAGNPGFGGEDLDNTMRLVFYPAIIGWTLLGLWMAQLWYRYQLVRDWVLEEKANWDTQQ